VGGSGGDGHLVTTTGKALERMKTRRATASEQTLNGDSGGAASQREQSPEDGLPGKLARRHEPRGLLGPATRIASVRSSDRATSGGLVLSKDGRIAGQRKALKGESQERPGQKWLEGSKGIKASREVGTLKTQRTGEWDPRFSDPSSWRSL
jgi:hypothetical protein